MDTGGIVERKVQRPLESCVWCGELSELVSKRQAYDGLRYERSPPAELARISTGWGDTYVLLNATFFH